MHGSVLQFFGRNLSEQEARDKRVLEVGSYDVNGSVRPLIEALGPASYLGCDMRAGPGVDTVADIASARLGVFDLVCSAGSLEHMEDWRGCISSMKRHVAPGGLLLLTTVSPGFPLHDYPADYWRFTLADMANIFCDMRFLALEPDPQVQGVFLKVQRCDPAAPCDLSRLHVFSMGDQ